MTEKNSVCIRCKYLDTSGEAFVVRKDGGREMIAECSYGNLGKNMGNRKNCVWFKAANTEVVEDRMRSFEKSEKMGTEK